MSVLVRDPAGLGEYTGRVDVVKGDVADQAAVDKAVAGSEAVLSALGHVKGSPRDVEATAMRNIVSSMAKAGARRLVVLSSAVVADPADKPTLGQRLTSWVVKTFRKDIYDDSLAKAQVIRDSGLDWTIVRAGLLTNGPPTGKYHAGRQEKGAGSRVSRADVAAFMLSCAADGKYVRELPYLSS